MLCSERVIQNYSAMVRSADAVSAIFGHEKKSVMKNVLKCLNIEKLLANVEMQASITKSAMDNLRTCTIKIIYKDQKSLTLTEARARKWHPMKKNHSFGSLLMRTLS